MPIIREWVKIVPEELKFLGLTNLIQFQVKNWTFIAIENGMGVKVRASTVTFIVLFHV